MSNVIPFPVHKARSGPPAGAPAKRGKSFGEVLLYTGVQYMRRHPNQPGAAAAPRAGDEKRR